VVGVSGERFDPRRHNVDRPCSKCGKVEEYVLTAEGAKALGIEPPEEPFLCVECVIERNADSWREEGYARAVEEGFSGSSDSRRRRDWDHDDLGDPRRYEGRLVDLAPLLAQPPRLTPWRVEGVVADGTLTILSGESGSGKSWLAQALCTGVARGRTVADFGCKLGQALYVDGEMGRELFVDRLRPTNVITPDFEYVDALGLDFSKAADLTWLAGVVAKVRANLVVIDSLRRLAPSKSENDSDDMAPIVSSIAKLARDTGAAVILIHHKGDSEKLYRGSTAIRDQADALFALLRHGDDTDLRRLRCKGGGKMRYAVEPEDVYLTITPASGGVSTATAPRTSSTQRDERTQAVLDALTGAVQSEREIAAETDVPRSSVQRILRELEGSGEAAQVAGGWATPWATQKTRKINVSERVAHVARPLGVDELGHPPDEEDGA
jgi:hypothetical protein